MAIPPFSAHRFGATFMRRTIKRSRAAWRRTMYAGTLRRRARSRSVASTAARKAAGVAYLRTYSGLLNGSSDKLLDTRRTALHSRVELVLRDETCVERARGGFDNYARVGADVGDVGNGPCGRCDLHTETVGHFITAQRYGCCVQSDGGRRLCGAWSSLPRQRQMDFVRTRRRQLVQSERSIVGDHSTTWRESEPGRDDVFARIRGHADQSIEATANPLEVAGGDMVDNAASAIAEPARLSGSEIPSLI